MPLASDPSDRFLTAAEFTPLLGYRTRAYALAALRRHGARMTRLGGRWLIERAELERVIAAASTQPQPARP